MAPGLPSGTEFEGGAESQRIQYPIAVGILWAVAPDTVSGRTTAHISTELLQETLLTLDQLTTAITMLAIHASLHPEQSPRMRVLLEGLLALIQACEGDLGRSVALDA